MPKHLAQDTCTNATDSLAHQVALKTPNESHVYPHPNWPPDGRHGYHERSLYICGVCKVPFQSAYPRMRMFLYVDLITRRAQIQWTSCG